MLQRLVNRFEIALHDHIAVPAVRLFDRVLNRSDGLFSRQHTADGEEAGLHNGIDAPAHTSSLSHLVSINHIEAQVFIDDGLLSLSGDFIPDLVRSIRAVEQEDRSRRSVLEDVKALQEIELVAADKVSFADQVGRLYWPRAEAQVRNRNSSRFL